MDAPVIVVSFAVGSAALAAWIFVRCPRFAPETLSRAAVHVGAAVVIGQLGLLVSQALGEARGDVLVFLFGIALPVIVYSFLSCLWMFRVCQDLLRGAIR